MLYLAQTPLWVLFLRLATPVFSVRIIGSPVLTTLEASPQLSEADLGKLPTEVDDKFDAFLESFADGITNFDDDFKAYDDDSFGDIGFDLSLALNSQIPAELVAEKQVGREPERTTEGFDALAETPVAAGVELVEAVPGLAVGAGLEKVEPEQTPTGPTIVSKPPIKADLIVGESAADAGPTTVGKPPIKADPIVGESAADAELAEGEPAGVLELKITEPEPAQDDFASEDRDLDLFNRVCRSREFQPTLENWWISGADQWLKNYTVESMNSPAFKTFGLVGSIVEKYLPTADFECKIVPGGGFLPNKCHINCTDTVARVENIEEAKMVFFVLAGVTGLAERIGGIYVSFLPLNYTSSAAYIHTQGLVSISNKKEIDRLYILFSSIYIFRFCLGLKVGVFLFVPGYGCCTRSPNTPKSGISPTVDTPHTSFGIYTHRHPLFVSCRIPFWRTVPAVRIF